MNLIPTADSGGYSRKMPSVKVPHEKWMH